jgi:hypothetical protein
MSRSIPAATALAVTTFNSAFQLAVRDMGPVTVNEHEGEVETIVPEASQPSKT